MHPELTSFAQAAGSTLVSLMTTDAWQRTREGLVRLFRRVQPQRADHLSAELDAGREDVLTAVAREDALTLDEVRAQWRGQFRRMLQEHPELAAELRAVLDEAAPPAPVPVLRATASGRARIYQAGRDQHITER